MASTAAANQAIFDRLSGMSQFHPATANLFADWTLDPGDVVTVRQGQTDYTVPIYQMNLDWRGKPMVEVQSTGSEKRPPLSALKRNSYGSGKRQEEQEQELIRHRADIETSNERLLLWATEDEWSEIAGEYQTTHKSQLEVNANGISSVVTGIDAGTFKESNSYAVGDVTVHNGKVYVFRTAHAANTPWDPTEVQEALNLYGSVKSHSTRIQQTESKIALVVDDNGIRRGEIILAINDDNTTTAGIRADKVILSSNGGASVMLSDKVDVLGSMEIISGGYLAVDGALYAQDDLHVAGDLDIGNGSVTISEFGSIECGSVEASSFQVANGGDLVNSHIGVTVTESNGQVTLTFAKADGGTPDTVTFSRASATRTVRTLTQSGGTVNVGSRVYTVDADIVYSDNDTGSSTIQIPLTIGSYDSTGKSYPLTVAGISGISVSASDAWQAGYDDGEQDMLDMYDVVSVTLGTVSKVGTASVSVPLSIEIGDYLSGNTKTVTRTVTPSVSSLLEARTGTNKITSNGTYTPSSGKLGFSTVVVDVDAGYTTPNYQCASNLTFKAGSAALTTQPTHMYALVQGNYEDMGSGYWYMRNTYMQVKTMYT
jgi:hypothetical protein